MRRALTLAFVVAAMSVGPGAGAASAQDLPPSLQGEQFEAFESLLMGQPIEEWIGSIDVSGECTPILGETFTLTYQASGPALGPYPGTFTESGTAIVTLTTAGQYGDTAWGVVTDWTANFTIDSAVGQVSGKKTFSAAGVYARCTRTGEPDEPGEVFLDVEQADARLHYEATIRTANGTFTDHGDAVALVSHACAGFARPTCGIHEQTYFHEQFSLSTGVLPLYTNGKATGGGQIGDITSLAQVTFGFEVKKTEDPDRLHGRCLVNDPAEETRVKCLTVTTYQQVGNTATWEGTAEVNGVQEDYRITVQDNGEPNQGIDTFSITTESYEVGGNVQHGNVQLHKQELTP